MKMDHSYGTGDMSAICVGAEYSSLEEFHRALAQYMRETNTVYNVAKSQCMNDHHLENASKNEAKNEILKRRLKYSYAVFGCKHYGVVRSKSRGLRPNQKTFKTDCPSHISVFTDRQRERLVVKTMVVQHNHHLGPDMAQLYPENRRVRGARRLDRKFCSSTRTLRNTLLPVSLPDASSLGMNVVAEDISVSANPLTLMEEWDECVLQLQEEFACHVHMRREDDELRAVFLQDTGMMQTFKAFPEFLCVDGNVSLLQGSIRLVFFIIVDSVGKSEIVGLGLLLSVQSDTVEWLLSTFVEQNQVSSNTTVVLNNWSRNHEDVLKSFFPDSALLLSPTQCLKEWKTHIPRGVSGVTEEGEDLAQQLLRRALGASSVDDYDQVHSEMVSALPPEILSYYDDQWHEHRHCWCFGISYGADFMSSAETPIESVRRRLALRSVTRGSVSAFFRRFFGELNRQRVEYSNSMSKSLHAIPGDVDERLSEYAGILTPYAFMLITEQHKLMDNCKPFDYIEKMANNRGTISVPVNACSCPFFVSVGLPCCHLFVRRHFLGLDMFDASLCPTRWTTEHYLATSSHRQVVKEIARPPTLFQKLSQATELASELATLLSRSSDEVFSQRMQVLNQLLQYWQNDQDVLLVHMVTECAEEQLEVSGR